MQANTQCLQAKELQDSLNNQHLTTNNMKCTFEVNVLSSRPYAFADKTTGAEVEMTEIVFLDDDGSVFKASKRGLLDIKQGKHSIVLNVKPNASLKAEVGVIEF